MKAALRQNIAWPCSCKVGSCGSCRATITDGEGKYPSSPCDPTALLTKDEMANGMVIACQWTPTTDITVDVKIGGEADKRGMI
jgi:ferredoxin